jgi:ArsR family transcriptional regulator
MEDLHNLLGNDVEGLSGDAASRMRTGQRKNADPARLAAHAEQAAAFLKAMAHEGRLLLLCHLAEGEKSVTELEQLLQMRQAAVSQQLARLRLEGLVSARRDGKTIYYSILDPNVLQTVNLVHSLFCVDE